MEFAVSVSLAMVTGRHFALIWRLPTHFKKLFSLDSAGFETDFNQIEAIAFPPPSNFKATYLSLGGSESWQECFPKANDYKTIARMQVRFKHKIKLKKRFLKFFALFGTYFGF